jgi:hypothetical protein
MVVAKENSNLTSNVDSVYSFLCGNQQADNTDDQLPLPETKHYIDLRLLNAEINPSMHSDGQLNRLKHSILKLNAP